jgi:hypothetical protein
VVDRIAEIEARYAAIIELGVGNDLVNDIAYLLDANRHMVESWETLAQMADSVGSSDHGLGCQVHYGQACDCAWAEFLQVLSSDR